VGLGSVAVADIDPHLTFILCSVECYLLQFGIVSIRTYNNDDNNTNTNTNTFTWSAPRGVAGCTGYRAGWRSRAEAKFQPTQSPSDALRPAAATYSPHCHRPSVIIGLRIIHLLGPGTGHGRRRKRRTHMRKRSNRRSRQSTEAMRSKGGKIQ
jgi:hypothetical protein